MKFSEKLDFLLKLTKTSNKEVAEELFFSQSYVSKLRRGHRELNDIVSIDKICTFFAKRLFLPSQIECLKENMNFVPLSEHPSNEELRLFLMEVFFVESEETVEKLDNVFYSLEPEAKVDINPEEEDLETDGPICSKEEQSIYNENKRKFLKFLDDILLSDNIEYAFISSNTNTFGFNSEPEVLEKLNDAIHHILEKNIKFDIIFNLARPFFEMIDIIDKWLYLMFKGNVNVWYLYDTSDTFTSHTIFGVSGVGSYNRYGLKDVNVCDIAIVYDTFFEYKRIEDHFKNILSHAEPMVVKYNPYNYKEQLKYSRELLNDGEFISINRFLSIYTMPKDILKEFLSDEKHNYLYELAIELQKQFKEHTKHFPFLEVIDSRILNLNKNVDEFYWNYKYSKAQLIRHLEATLKELKENENYNLIEIDNLEDYTVFQINKKRGALVVFFNDDCKGLFTNSPTVTSLLDKYLRMKYPVKDFNNRSEIMDKLIAKIDSLK